MRSRSEDLVAAASTIGPEVLGEAKAQVAGLCEDYIRWAEIFSERLYLVGPGDLHRFARALALVMLGHLPTRPQTCPFCIQHQRCEGCGYAEVHGRCDEDDSSFCLFIEAFQDLGRAIYQDTEEGCLSQDQAAALIHSWLSASIDAARAMKDRLEPLSPGEFMEAKAWYLGRMISFIPSELFSDDVGRAVQTVRLRLEDYW